MPKELNVDVLMRTFVGGAKAMTADQLSPLVQNNNLNNLLSLALKQGLVKKTSTVVALYYLSHEGVEYVHHLKAASDNRIQELIKRKEILEEELSKEQENLPFDFELESKKYIDQLHEYNEIKDLGQMLLGKMAELEGTSTKEQYEKYGLSLID